MPFGSIASDRLRNINYERMRAYRLERTKQMMEEDGLDAIITWEPWDIRYIASAYVPMATRWGGQQFVVLPRNGEPHLFSYTCYATEALQEEMPWLNGRVWAAPEGGKFVTRLEQTDTFLQRVCGILAEYGITSGLIGLDACPSFAVYAEALQRAGFSVTDPVLTMFKARMIKNEDELACVRYACYAADAAFAAIQKAIRPGVREIDLALEMEVFMRSRGASGLAFPIIFISGPNTSMPHGVPGERLIEEGDFITMDYGARWGGYCADMTRTVAVGQPSAEMEKVYNTVLTAQLACCREMRPGMTGAEVDAIAREIIDSAGYKGRFGHGLGHSLGIEIHEDPRCSPRDNTVLRPGMTMTIEPGIYLPGKFGVRIEDSVVLTEDGIEIFGSSDKNLIVL